MASPRPFSIAPERRTHLDLDGKYANTYFSKMYYLGQIISPSFLEFKNKRIGHISLALLPSRLNNEVAGRNAQGSNFQIAPLTVPLSKMISQVKQVYDLFDAVNDVADSDAQNKYLQLLLHALIRSAQLVDEFEDLLSLWIKGERQNKHATVTEAIYAICTARSDDLFMRLHDQAFGCRSRQPFCATLNEYCTSTAIMIGDVEAWIEAQDSGSDTVMGDSEDSEDREDREDTENTENTEDTEDTTTKVTGKESDEQDGDNAVVVVLV